MENARENFTVAKEQSQRAFQIITRLSSFAKKGVHQAPEIARVNLADILDNIFPLLRFDLVTNNIQLEKTIPSEAAWVLADRGYLEEVFFNLIVNAAQAIKSLKRGGLIRVASQAVHESVRITIEDNGPGMSGQALAHLFEPFYTTKEEGTGLGLYVTKQLVEKIGGKIGVESEAGKFTAFILEFKTAGDWK